MSLILVNSSAIRAVGYDGHTLAVVFTITDATYTPRRAPDSVNLGRMRAGSKGWFYNPVIRGRHR